MTFLYPQRPQPEAAPTVPSTPDKLTAQPLPTETAPTRIVTPDPGPSGEVIRHILIGSPEGIRETIYALHLKRYVEQAMWTGPVNIGPNGVTITRNEGDILFYLMRLRSLDAVR